MRVLLDAHVSSRHVGRPLVAAGHDVLALDQDDALGWLADEDVLALATEQGRIVVTHNVRHFAPIVRRWAEAGRPYAGCLLITLPHTAYGPILRGIERGFATWPTQEDWIGRAVFIAGGE